MSRENGILDLVMKGEWFEKIKSGEKNIEYREVKKSWASRIFQTVKDEETGTQTTKQAVNLVLLSNNYARKEQMLFEIKMIEVLPSGINTDLHIDKPVYAIHLGKQLNIVEWYKQQKGGKNVI